MGEHNVTGGLQGPELRRFMKHLLTDLQVLDAMLKAGVFERGVQRIGAEQELFLVDGMWRPAPVSLAMLDRLDDPHFTTEIAAFNLECNLDPMVFSGDCLGRLEGQIVEMLGKVDAAGAGLGVASVLAGILPTIRKANVGADSATPVARYAALNATLRQMRGGPYEFRIKGTDELIFKHESVMIEGCNTSFQVHLQVEPEQFAALYNIAQVVAAPVLAAAVNSPMLFGRRLWRETRIALFQQSIDTRGSTDSLRERSPRVTFGSQWVRESVLELYREDITRFRALLGVAIDEDPWQKFRAGEAPDLRALRLFNGTIYRWNRPCYGVTDGKPHLRIENRILPSGPTPVDEVANAAFWLGLMQAMPTACGDVTQRMNFDDAKMNFTVAARLGLSGQFTWFDGEVLPAQTLILDRLLPIAREGLSQAGVDQGAIDRYLGVIDERVRCGQTGAMWTIRSFDRTKGQGKLGERLNALVAGMRARQKTGEPVARWELANLGEAGDVRPSFLHVEQYMTTDLFTVHEDEPVELVASLMDWKQIRHVPVEDDEMRLVGVVSYRTLLRMMAQGDTQRDGIPIPVSDVMRRNPIVVGPETTTRDAIAIMRQHRISALPVVEGDRLVGIVTERDFMNVTAELLLERVGE